MSEINEKYRFQSLKHFERLTNYMAEIWHTVTKKILGVTSLEPQLCFHSSFLRVHTLGGSR